MKKLLLLGVLSVFLVFSVPANADLLGYYYNLPETHPDMETPITGLQTGWVESTLTGSTPTLTALGATFINQFDWWSSAYLVGSRIDSDADLQSNFASSWFPLDQGVGAGTGPAGGRRFTALSGRGATH